MSAVLTSGSFMMHLEKGSSFARKGMLLPPWDTHATLDRLAHEYALKDDLEAGWAARPLDLLRERGRSLLVLEDPGGVPLAQLVGRRFGVAEPGH